MDKISEAVVNYIHMKSTGALLITGDWGSGKTFHLKNKVFKKIEEHTDRIPIIISLFGESSKDSIGQKIMYAYLDKKGKSAKLSMGTFAKNLKPILESIPKIKEYVDLEKIIVGTGESLIRILPHNKLIIVFDDIERKGQNLPIDEFLGMVNDMVENIGCKVILVANESELEGGITYKEKTIEKTLQFIPNIEEVFNSIIKSYEKSQFKDFITDHHAFFIKSIDASATNNTDIKKNYSNIRTLKFAVEHFNYVCELFPQKTENFQDPLTISQIKNLWHFIIGVSIEFRKPNNLSFIYRKNLDIPTLSLFDLDSLNIDYGDVLLAEEDEVPTQNHSAYFERFKKIYFDRFKDQYIYHETVYDLITGGRKIDLFKFRKDLERSYNSKNGEIPLGHQILNKIQQEGPWSFTNVEFVDALNQLLDQCKKGLLNDMLSYLNAGVYIIKFNEIIGKSSESIVDTIKKGIDIFFTDEIHTNSSLQQWDMIGDHFSQSPNLQLIVDYVGNKLDEFKTKKAKENADRIEALFINNIQAFVNEFSPDTTGIVSLGEPFLQNLNALTVQAAIKRWGPKEIMLMNSFLQKRYINTSMAERLVSEIDFLYNLRTGIEDINLEEILLSNSLIQMHMVPKIEQCLKILLIDPTNLEVP